MRRRLNLVVVAVTAMVVVAFLVPLALTVRTLARDRAVGAAEREARTLAGAVGAIYPQAGAEGVRLLIGSGLRGGQHVTVFLPGDVVVGAEATDSQNVFTARGGEAFRIEVPGGEAVFVPVLRELNAAPIVIRFFVAEELLNQNVGRAWTLLAGLGLVLVALSALVADRLGRSMVHPVQRLSDAAHRLSDGALDVRVEPEGPPEIVEVAEAFNRLGARIGSLVAEEREAVADLSHRLRTPLTVLRLEIEAVADADGAERLAGSVDDLERQVDRLITEARRPIRQGGGVLTDLAAVVRERAEFWGPLAEEQGRAWRLDADGSCPIGMHRDDVSVVVDALIENVLSHTDEGVGFRVAVDCTGARTLVVEDDGSGYPSTDVLDRGVSAGGSTGLGLDIVRQAATATGGSVEIGESDSGGARIVVTFGS